MIIDLEKEYTMATTENNAVDDMKHCYENLILIDVGANLTNKKYSRDLDAVVQRAQDSGISILYFSYNFTFIDGAMICLIDCGMRECLLKRNAQIISNKMCNWNYLFNENVNSFIVKQIEAIIKAATTTIKQRNVI